MQTIRLLLACSLLMAGMQATAGTHTCPDLDVPPAPVCVASPYGLAYADTAQDAEAAASAQAGAAGRFATHFGEAPTGVLILSTSYNATDANTFARTNGLAYAQIWLSGSEQQKMATRAMRRAGMDRDRIRRAATAMARQQDDTLRHEVGHSMYAALFWSNAEKSSETRYGSPAPDWLDEAAAVLMESADSQVARAREFFKATSAAPRSIPTLVEFLDMEHPIRTPTLARELKRGQSSDSGVQMMVSRDTDVAGIASFYGQSLLTGLFLMEASGDPQILSPISTAIASGTPFSDWLAANGAANGLPDNPDALQAAWETWSRELPEQPQDTN